ncbi:hypothetical protein HNQ51_001506 [Inhella inkyongensis]|uniref:Uncharacterized protein n=1 Tax=Inhella inkyongensis TaxID=392593 RepID=A0A840S3A6_9BURK|nr:hypothetical protein [Inhella inkyongensis]MBB5204213.1 hypothetical protein [Inhella inkyongensis]
MQTPASRISASQVSHAAAHARVARKLGPTSRGALKWAQRFGADLLCVRHRLSADGATRYTTVELLVDSAPVAARATREVGLRIGVLERDLQAAARAAGARWDPAAKLWRISKREALRMKLGSRIVEES